ncbi:hypothetical protein GCM10009720_21240 [Yaniella flava]|uniref:Uncharacterized protein n=1 Tax=Yaniella flava TaxID=287930 RepID=A0ABN2UQF0_9MICC
MPTRSDILPDQANAAMDDIQQEMAQADRDYEEAVFQAEELERKMNELPDDADQSALDDLSRQHQEAEQKITETRMDSDSVSQHLGQVQYFWFEEQVDDDGEDSSGDL